MKICFFNDYRLGVVKGDAVVDVTDAVKDIPHTGPHNLINGLIERLGDYKKKLEDAANKRQGRAGQLRQIPRRRCREPSNIDCMAVNYMEDGTRKEPAPINAFINRRTASSAMATPWCCPMCRRPSSKARPRSRWSSASAPRT